MAERENVYFLEGRNERVIIVSVNSSGKTIVRNRYNKYIKCYIQDLTKIF